MAKRLLLSLSGCLLAPLLLIGCNGGEDFSDADVGAPIVQPTPGSGEPLEDDVDRIEVAFVDDPVLGLGYRCRGENVSSGTGYIGRQFTGSRYEEIDGEVAVCGKRNEDQDEFAVTRVDFFIGDNSEGDVIELGTVYLPESVQQQRYQVAPTDVVQSPARVKAGMDSGENKKAFYLAALLQALDDTSSSGPDEIVIPAYAHEMVLNCCSENDGTVVPAPEPLFDYDTYDNGAGSFVGQDCSAFDTTDPNEPVSWQCWLDTIENEGNVTLAGFGQESQVLGALHAGLDRLRAGSFRLVSAPYTREFVVDGEGSGFVPPMVLQFPFLVYPDGQAQGMGYAADVTNTDDGAERGPDNLIALQSGAQMDDRLFLTGSNNDFWHLNQVFDSGSQVDLSLTGRVLGLSVYYHLDGPDVSGTDYSFDYTQDGVYEPTASQDGSYFWGEAFGTSFGDSPDDGELLQGSREGIVGFAPDNNLYGSTGSTSLEFYTLKPWKACVGTSRDDSNCEDIDGNEQPLNYPESVDLDGAEEGADPQDVAQEQPKPATDADDNPDSHEAFNIQVRDDGYIVTDLDNDCEPTREITDADGRVTGYEEDNADADTEYRVGFVTRTNGDSTNGSVNIIIHMTGPRDLQDVLPHYGLRTNGRIDLDGQDDGESMPLYRTGDSNFDDRVRALWLDQVAGTGYAAESYENELDSEPNDDQRYERLARTRGSIQGYQASCP